MIVFPFWPLSVLAGVWLGWDAYRGFRRRRRAGEKICARCSYDLRAHKVGDRCPECGAVVGGAAGGAGVTLE